VRRHGHAARLGDDGARPRDEQRDAAAEVRRLDVERRQLAGERERRRCHRSSSPPRAAAGWCVAFPIEEAESLTDAEPDSEMMPEPKTLSKVPLG